VAYFACGGVFHSGDLIVAKNGRHQPTCRLCEDRSNATKKAFWASANNLRWWVIVNRRIPAT